MASWNNDIWDLNEYSQLKNKSLLDPTSLYFLISLDKEIPC